MKILINLKFGSKFQEQAGKAMMKAMLEAFEMNFKNRHKENEMDIDITDE